MPHRTRRRRELLGVPIMRDLDLRRPRRGRHEHQREPTVLRRLSSRLSKPDRAEKPHRSLQIARSNHGVQKRHVAILGKRVIRVRR